MFISLWKTLITFKNCKQQQSVRNIGNPILPIILFVSNKFCILNSDNQFQYLHELRFQTAWELNHISYLPSYMLPRPPFLVSMFHMVANLAIILRASLPMTNYLPWRGTMRHWTSFEFGWCLAWWHMHEHILHCIAMVPKAGLNSTTAINCIFILSITLMSM